MRALIAAVWLSTGCSKLLGITDPVAGDASTDPGDTTAIDTIDAPPPCAPGTAFGTEQSFSLGTGGDLGVSFALGELDGKMGIDVAVATGGDIVIMSGAGMGTFTRGIALGSAASHLVIADFDIDADDDIVAFAQGSTRVFARRQNSVVDPSAFEAEQGLPTMFTNVNAVRTGFFDGAFVPDLIVQDGTRSQVFTANLGTPGTFAAGATLGGINNDLAFVMQLDGVNRDDVVFVDNNGIVPAVKVQLSTGASFGMAAVIGNVIGFGVGAGQLVATPGPDLVLADSPGGKIYANNGNGQFAATAATIAALTEGTLQVADANNDGLLDLMTPTKVVIQCPSPVPGGAGTFTQIEPIVATPPALLVDVNKDNKLDLVRLDADQLKVRLQ